MKTKNLLLIIGVISLLLFPHMLQAQIGTSDNNYQSSSSSSIDLKEQNSDRISDLENRLKDANDQLKGARNVEKEAKQAVMEAKAALKAEKQAQKARKQANDQAEKAVKAKERSDENM